MWERRHLVCQAKEGGHGTSCRKTLTLPPKLGLAGSPDPFCPAQLSSVLDTPPNVLERLPLHPANGPPPKPKPGKLSAGPPSFRKASRLLGPGLSGTRSVSPPASRRPAEERWWLCAPAGRWKSGWWAGRMVNWRTRVSAVVRMVEEEDAMEDAVVDWVEKCEEGGYVAAEGEEEEEA